MRDRVNYFTALIGTLVIAGLAWILYEVVLPHGKNHLIQLYYADNISLSHQIAIDEFNRLYHGKIEIIPVNLPFSNFSTNERKELLTRSLRSKSEKLDIFAVDVIWVPRFAKWCEPLDSYFSEEEKQRLLPDAVSSCVFENTLYAMPMYLDIGVLYYRHDILRTLPDAVAIEKRLQESITWEELKRLRVRLGYMNKPFFIFPAKDFEGFLCNYLELAVGYDPKFLQSNTIPVTLPASKNALQMMVNFVKDGTTPPEVIDFDEVRCNTYMLDHDAVFLRSWEDLVQNFRTTYRDTAKLRLLTRVPMPHFEGRPSSSIFGGWNFMISKSSTKKAAAIEYIKFYQRESTQRMIFERMGYLPAIKSVYDDTAFAKTHADILFYRTMLQHGFHRPALVEYTRVSDIISHYAQLAIKQELSVDEALARADEMIRSNKVLIK